MTDNLEAALSAPTSVWVRHCGLCGRLDLRQWFANPADGEASEGDWACPDCGLASGLEYEEGSFDELFGGAG